MKKILIFLGSLVLLFIAGWYIYHGIYIQHIKFPLKTGTITAGVTNVSSGTISLKSYNVIWDQEALTLRVTDKNSGVLLNTIPGVSFVHGAVGKETVAEARGSFFVHDQLEIRCLSQTVERLEKTGTDIVWMKGRILCGKDQTGKEIAGNYILEFREKKENELEFSLRVDNPRINRLYLTSSSDAGAYYTGFGEQFSYLNMNGRRLPIFIMEQGIGRGDEPITTGADLTAKSGGDWHTSYAGMPFYLKAGAGRPVSGFYLTNTQYSVFDFRNSSIAQVEVFSSAMNGSFLSGKNGYEIITTFTEYTGRMRTLPDWMIGGAILGIQGGTEKVKNIYAQFKALGTPISGFWLQDWVGQRKTSFGKQLWWNWELDHERYPQWEEMVKELEDDHVYVLIYINPFLADVKDKKNARNNYFEIARKKGYLVKKPDGQDYLILNTSFSAALVDLSNPRAYAWMKELIKKEMVSTGARGWMADFGEVLPRDARLYSGVSGAANHNQYPVEWARLNREVVDSIPEGKDYVFFTRAGFTRSPGYSTLFWEGDQMVSWDRHDGIQSAAIGLLSGGISGISLNHSDIGGYTTITNPIANYHRSKELLIRWMELNAMSVVFRSHEGNRPDENHQIYSDEETRKYFDKMAKLYASWMPYRRKLVEEASKTGIPVVRHPMLVFPENPRVYFDGVPDYLMVGEDLILAPVYHKGQTRVEFQLPDGQWIHIWTQKEYPAGKVCIAAPLGEPAVFYKKGSDSGNEMTERARILGILK